MPHSPVYKWIGKFKQGKLSIPLCISGLQISRKARQGGIPLFIRGFRSSNKQSSYYYMLKWVADFKQDKKGNLLCDIRLLNLSKAMEALLCTYLGC